MDGDGGGVVYVRTHCDILVVRGRGRSGFVYDVLYRVSVFHLLFLVFTSPSHTDFSLSISPPISKRPMELAS